MRLSLLPLLPALVLGCSSPRAVDAAEPPALVLVPGWASLPHPEFGTWVDEELPELTRRPLAPAALDELTEALAGGGETSVRAAVILGRSRTREAADVLLARLSSRTTSKERAGDAGDVVAAHALASHPRARKLAPALADLAVGDEPHPDPEVRVECAVAALASGRDEVVPWLLTVLYVGTPRGRTLPLDFEESSTTAWIRGRAAQALSQRAGLPLAYHYDAPLADREREADRLARQLGIEPPGIGSHEIVPAGI